MHRDNQIVSHIIGINALVWIFTFIMERKGIPLNSLGGMFYAHSPFFQPWQPITHMFMHGGLLHIAFNMYALYLFSSILERVWGWRRFLFFYISAGLGAALIHQIATGVEAYMLFNSIYPPPEASCWEWPDMCIPVVGASGAVMGVVVAFGLLFPNTRLQLLFPPIPIAAKYLVLIVIAFDAYFVIQGIDDGIAHWAHLGGAATGFMVVKIWSLNRDTFY